MRTAYPRANGSASLPAELTSFVGRRRELEDTRRLLGESRLVTLTGAGGVGKTRLSLRVATQVRRIFPDGVWFIELASLQDAELLPQTIASALHLPQVSSAPASYVAAYLESKRLLLVLDNCEHISDACATLVSKLLTAAPGLSVLTTSRHVLGVEGEQILAVPPLTTPGEDVAAGDAGHYDAVRLFLDRASAVAPGFAIGDHNRAAVLELCRRLDGIPLAIELAAVWLRALTIEQTLERLEGRLTLLAADRPAAPARQQALDATVAWSYDLCSPTEQQLWARLSVFSGGFDLETAEEVCSVDGIYRAEILGLIAGLVNKSIIVRHQATETRTARYEMLEIIRQYGACRLDDANQTHMLRVRHHDYYRAIAQRFAAEGVGPDEANWLLRLRREHGNLRAALNFCLTEEAEATTAFDIAVPLLFFWLSGFPTEGLRYLVQALARATDPTPERATALWAAAYLATSAGQLDRAEGLLGEAAELAERFDDDVLRARISECRGQVLVLRGDLSAAAALLQDALSRYRALEKPHGECIALSLLAITMFFLEDDRDREFSQSALALADQLGAQSFEAYARLCVGLTHVRAGEFDEARQYLRDALQLFQYGHLTGAAFTVQVMAWCAARVSPDERAARLLGATHSLWRASGAGLDDTNIFAEFNGRSRRTVRDAIGEAAFAEAFAEGSMYSWDETVALAMEGVEHRPVAEEHGSDWRSRAATVAGLTPRETEVAMLVGQGLSNRDVAARLVISQRTAEAHVNHILAKLGMTSRTQVASWVAEQRLR